MYSFLVCAKFQPISASFTPVRWEVGISFLLSAEISQTHKKRIRKTLGQFIAIYFSLFSRNSGLYFKLVLIYGTPLPRCPRYISQRQPRIPGGGGARGTRRERKGHCVTYFERRRHELSLLSRWVSIHMFDFV